MPLRTDRAALRRRLSQDGYLFFRTLVRPADVTAAYESVCAELRLGAWMDGNGHPAGQQRAINVRDALADPSFRAALASRGLNRLPYLPPIRSLVRTVLGPGAFSYPVKVLRTVYPERPFQLTRGRFVHQDIAVAGVQDMLTTWLPLMDIPAQLGGLAVLPGSHLGPPQRPRPLRADEPRWATTDYRPGDVLLFHCLTAHAALPNHASTLRVSTDVRWQSADQPAPAEFVLGPAITSTMAGSAVNGSAVAAAGRRAPQAELYSRLLSREPWWEPVPSGLMLQPRHELAAVPPAPSRLFTIHPDWQRWQPPAGPVH
jgi:hypothetical protein